MRAPEGQPSKNVKNRIFVYIHKKQYFLYIFFISFLLIGFFNLMTTRHTGVRSELPISPFDFLILGVFLYVIYQFVAKCYRPSDHLKWLMFVLSGIFIILTALSTYHFVMDTSSIFGIFAQLRNLYLTVTIVFFIDILRQKEIRDLFRVVEISMIIFGLILTLYIIILIRIFYQTGSFGYYSWTTYIATLLMLMPIGFNYIARPASNIFLRIAVFVSNATLFTAIFITGGRFAAILFLVLLLYCIFKNFKFTKTAFIYLVLFLSAFAVSGIYGMTVPPASGIVVSRTARLAAGFGFSTLVSEGLAGHMTSDGHNVSENDNHTIFGIDAAEFYHRVQTGVASAEISDSFRMTIWSESARVISDNLLLGAGVRFVEVPFLFDTDVNNYTTRISMPHNFILETGLLMGIPGIIAYLTLLGFAFVPIVFFRGNLKLHQKLDLILICFVCFGFGFIQPVLTSGPMLGALLWFVYGWYCLQHDQSLKFDNELGL